CAVTAGPKSHSPEPMLVPASTMPGPTRPTHSRQPGLGGSGKSPSCHAGRYLPLSTPGPSSPVGTSGSNVIERILLVHRATRIRRGKGEYGTNARRSKTIVISHAPSHGIAPAPSPLVQSLP